MTNANIAEAIAAAKANAGAVAPVAAASLGGTGSAVATTGPRPSPLSLDDFNSGGMSVDVFLKVNEDGIKAGDSALIAGDLNAVIDMSAVGVCSVIKYGNPAVYVKTYNMQDCVQGGTWAAAVERAQRADPKARPYMSADIPLRVLEEVKDIKGKVALDPTKLAGISLSTTNKKQFADFLASVKEVGLEGAPVQVKIGSAPQAKGQYKWGVFTFELIGPAP